MIDNHLKDKYRNIIYRFKNINKQIEILNNDIVSLKNNINKNILINDKGLEEEEITNVSAELISVSKEIENIIIPNLERNLYY